MYGLYNDVLSCMKMTSKSKRQIVRSQHALFHRATTAVDGFLRSRRVIQMTCECIPVVRTGEAYQTPLIIFGMRSV